MSPPLEAANPLLISKDLLGSQEVTDGSDEDDHDDHDYHEDDHDGHGLHIMMILMIRIRTLMVMTIYLENFVDDAGMEK